MAFFTKERLTRMYIVLYILVMIFILYNFVVYFINLSFGYVRLTNEEIDSLNSLISNYEKLHEHELKMKLKELLKTKAYALYQYVIFNSHYMLKNKDAYFDCILNVELILENMFGPFYK